MPLGPDLTASERSDVGGLRGQNFVALVLAEAWAAHSTALPGAVSRCARWEEMLRNYFETVEWIEWNPNLFPRKFGALQRVILNPNAEIAAAWVVGGTGDPPGPCGDSPHGTSKGDEFCLAPVCLGTLAVIPSGQWPDGTGQWPVPPISTSVFGVNSCAFVVSPFPP